MLFGSTVASILNWMLTDKSRVDTSTNRESASPPATIRDFRAELEERYRPRVFRLHGGTWREVTDPSCVRDRPISPFPSADALGERGYAPAVRQRTLLSSATV